MKKLILALTLAATAMVAIAAPDTTLRIAFVATPQVSLYEKSLVQEHAAVIQDAFDDVQNIAIPELQALSLDLVNGGVPHSIPGTIPASSGTLDGLSMSATLAAAYDNGNAMAQYVRSFRNQINADIVILYANVNGTTCGATSGVSGTFAQGSFVPDATYGGRDLSDSERNWIAVISTYCLDPVFKFVASGHELAHLFGGTHAKRVDDTPADTLQGVLSDNKANAYVSFFDARGTLGASPVSDVAVPKSSFAFAPNIYSNTGGIGLDGNATHNNRDAARLTAASIAAYRPKLEGTALPPAPVNPPPVPSCALSKPAFVTAYVVDVCEPQYFGTTYRFDWVDFCSSATDHYEVWGALNGGSYQLKWTSETPWTYGIIVNGEADVKVKACSASSCTGLSSPAVTVVDQC